VTVSLDGSAGDGQAGEGDNVGTGIDNVVGGDGNDYITGNAGANSLTGGPGDDHLTGLGGADLIDGGAGSDTIGCGDGSDTVANDAWDGVAADCETLGAAIAPPVDVAGGGSGSGGGGGSPVARPALSQRVPRVPDQSPLLGSDGTVALRVSCPAAAVGGCAGNVTLQLPTASAGKLTAAGRRKPASVGARRFKLAAGTTQSIPVRLSRRAVRRLHTRHKLVVRVVLAVTIEGSTATSSRTVKILERRTRARHPTRRPTRRKRR
jgi:Ca2+-binding RTX toxin-like protein